ncbi:cytochrome c oxidase assembly protein [Chiayiivirga flava]|uniref:Cytochrome c oxidase assembly protein CtaG n=1 Tax=Chiayiivirga flava TaxID=659595 RepID=A0A7W8D981_9GAMM|nr:cytochrome c oxidase assembly protein subunit 11 [Chiayiivirga flava]
MNTERDTAAAKETGSVVRRALVVAAIAFVFCFSLVPLYRIACEQIFGIKLGDGPVGEAKAGGFAVDTSRWVTVEFDAGVNSGLPWEFRPAVSQVKVHPGQPTDALYYARNTSVVPIVGQAVPSVAPSTASNYFNKTECFCFTEQRLEAGEERPMPVRFVVDPDLPAEVSTLTLSYTFYNNELATARIASEGVAHVTP